MALATRPPICGELLGSPLCEPVTAVEIGVRAATVHPVNTETIKNMTIRPCWRSASGRQPPSSGVRPRCVAWFPPTGWHRASRRAPSIRPARLCRAMAAPTWFGRAPLHAAVISSCVLPIARARTWSPRLDELCLPPAALALAVRERPGTSDLVAAVGVLAEASSFSK